jgi:hypothetical protein
MSLVSPIRTMLGALLAGRAAAGDATKAAAADKPGDAPAKSDSAGPPPDELKAAVDRIRATSRGIVTGFAAVAALVVGTAPLDRFGKVELFSTAFWVCAGGLTLVLGGIALVIGQAAAVDAPVGASPEQLKLAERNATPDEKTLRKDHHEVGDAVRWIKAADLVDVRKVPKRPPVLDPVLPGSCPISYLADERDTARDQLLQGQLKLELEPDAKERAGLEEQLAPFRARLARLNDELNYVVKVANYHRLSRRFDDRKPKIVCAALAAALGIVAFTYAAEQGATKESGLQLAGVELRRAVGVDLHGAALEGARLAGADLRRSNLSSADLTAAVLTQAKLAGADLSKADLSAADLAGATGLSESAVKGATWTGATCPDGTRLTDVDDTCATKERLIAAAG